MKIEVLKYRLDFKFEAGTSRGVMTSKDSYFLKLYDLENPDVFGIGECSPLAGLSPDLEGDLQDTIEECSHEVQEIDIIDANAGDHGQPFATNFNPEINIREVTATCRHWENENWVESGALQTRRSFDFPEGIGPMNIYRMYHEEMESLVKHIPTIKRLSSG